MLDENARVQLWRRVTEVIEDHVKKIPAHRVAPVLNLEEIRGALEPFDFERPLDALDAVDFAAKGMWQYQVHTPHPRYFGLFNPAPTTMGIAADALVAAFNPQIAAWSHSPFAAEVERHLVRAFGLKFGYEAEAIDGTFASGGAEANHTALLTALVNSFPRFAREGLRALPAQPVFYVTDQSHHSFLKAARLTGLGTDGVREIPISDDLKMNTDALASQIKRDRAEGFAPFMVVATAGTTNAGVIDPVEEIADVAHEEKLWLHTDAAWGGAVAIVSEMRSLLAGIERADSITFDAHKWLNVPMGAGIYITRHREILSRTCGIYTDYMPRDAADLEIADPYAHSMQWSRRFTGLKVFLSLAVAGWEGYAEAIRHQTALGNLLREKLTASKWKVLNKTPLPVVCFVDEENGEGNSADYLEKVVRELLSSGKAWISTTRLREGVTVLRACITNYRTEREDVQALVDALNEARRSL